MGASGQTLYLKIEQNCIVYERSVKLQDIASVECTDVGIRRQVLQEINALGLEANADRITEVVEGRLRDEIRDLKKELRQMTEANK